MLSAYCLAKVSMLAAADFVPDVIAVHVNSFLTATRKYRLHSMASRVTVSVHASTMSELHKEMYPSLRQL